MNQAVAKIDPKEFGLDPSKAVEIEKAFQPKIAEREGLEVVYSNIIKQEISDNLVDDAKSARLKLVKVRTGISDIHKTQKAYFRAAGLFVDAWKNKETLPVVQMEEKLFEIEDYYQKIERERLDELERERTDQLSEYGVLECEHLGLRGMSKIAFDQFLNYSKTLHEQKEKDDRQAERDRIKKEKEDAMAIRKTKTENKRLRKEADDAEEILETERRAREKIQTELDDKIEAEEAKNKADKKAQRAAAAAPDRVKLEQLAVSVVSMKMPEVNSDEAKAVIVNVVKLLNKTSNFIKEQTVKLS